MGKLLKMARLSLITIILVLSGTLAHGGAPEEKYFLIILPDNREPWVHDTYFWAWQRMMFWCRQDKNLNFEILAGQSESETAKAIAHKPDAVIALTIGGAPFNPAIQQYYESGGFTILIGTSFTPNRQDIYVTGDQRAFGRLAAEFIAQEIGFKGRVAAMEGLPGSINTERMLGFREALAQYPEISITVSEPAYWNAEKGRDLMKSYLARFDDINAIWCQNDVLAQAALKVYNQSHRGDLKIIMGGNGRQHTIKRIMESGGLFRGDLSHTRTIVKGGIDLAVRAIENGEDFPAVIAAPPELITRENAADYYFENAN